METPPENLENLINIIKKKNPKKILLQVPEGMKLRILEIAGEIEKTGCEVIVSADPCYGACDLPLYDAEQAGADMIVHIGHREFPRKPETKTRSEEIPIVYADWKSEVKLDDKILSEIRKIKEQRIGLISSVQYLDILPVLEKEINQTGKTAIVGGHILGCQQDNAKKIETDIDCLLFVGTGYFHPLGVKSGKKIYFIDLEQNRLREMRDELLRLDMLRLGKIEKARNAKVFAILVSSKPGQFSLKKAEEIKRSLEQKDKKAFILIMDEIKNEKLLGIKADAYINTACPRIIYDTFDKPIINAEDVGELLKEE